MRWLLTVLLTLNMCYLLWMLLVPAPAEPENDVFPGNVPSLQLLEAATPGHCVRVGPFGGEEEQDRFIADHAADADFARQSESYRPDPAYRVFLPPRADRDAAVADLEVLREALEQNELAIDSFVITSGERENGISLGLFRERDNALGVQSRMAPLEYDVQIVEEGTEEASWWLILTAEDAESIQARWSEIEGEHEGLTISENLCEMIAPELHFP